MVTVAGVYRAPLGMHTLRRSEMESELSASFAPRVLRTYGSPPFLLINIFDVGQKPTIKNGDRGRSRTCDPQLRKLMLYPTELHDHVRAW